MAVAVQRWMARLVAHDQIRMALDYVVVMVVVVVVVQCPVHPVAETVQRWTMKLVDQMASDSYVVVVVVVV